MGNRLNIRKAYLNATRAGYTAESKSEFFQGSGAISAELTFVTNHVLFAETCLTNLREPDYGSLAFVEFEVNKVPPEQVTSDLTYQQLI